MELLVPYEEGGSLSELHDLAGELEREDTAEGVRVRARVPAAAAQRFERFAEDGASPRA
jgi:GTPase